MFALVVHEPDRAPYRKAFAVRECRIGSARDNELVLDARHGITRHHVRLVRNTDGIFILIKTKTTSRILVNERKLKAPQIVKPGDAIALGELRIEIVCLPYETLRGGTLVPRDAREAELLDAASADHEARLVYADWLEGNGDHAKAEVLRIQHALANDADDKAVEAATARVRHLASAIELPWRARLTKLPIDNCPQFRFKCPRQWADLEQTPVDGERFCGECQRTVYFCATIDEARVRGAEGKCVAIDVTSARWKLDMAPPFGESLCTKCQLDVGVGLGNCPRCGAEVFNNMVMEMGEIG